jgi:uncharacterized protein (DUF1778 family)
MARDKRLEIKLTDDELTIIAAAAERAGAAVSVWVRMMALAAAREGK